MMDRRSQLAGVGALHNQRGATLVEAMVAALLLGILFLTAFALYERSVFVWNRGEKTADLQDHLRIAMHTLAGDIREGRGMVYLSGPPAEIGEGAVAELIELVVPKRERPGENEIIRYSWAAVGTGDTRNVLRRQVRSGGPDPPQPVAHHITYVRISPQGPRLVEVALRAAGEYRGRPVEVEMQGVYYMRAAE